YRSRRPMLAAVTATSSDLVFTGELDGDFLVLHGRDGAVLYRFNTGGAMTGGVVTYQVAGKQYVAATSGSATFFWRTPPGSATVVIFSLPTPGPQPIAPTAWRGPDRPTSRPTIRSRATKTSATEAACGRRSGAPGRLTSAPSAERPGASA